MKLIIGTKNKAKLGQIQGALSDLDLEIVGLPDKNLPDVVEDGKTAQENGRKKALAYAHALNERVFSMDNALYIDGLSEDKQPGINVRRIDGRSDRPTDQEMLDYYSRLIEGLGGKADGHWEFAICIANPNGEIKETTIISKRIFTSKSSEKVMNGYPLNSIQINPNLGKYISEMKKDEQDKFWEKMIGEPLGKFVRESLGL